MEGILSFGLHFLLLSLLAIFGGDEITATFSLVDWGNYVTNIAILFPETISMYTCGIEK